MGTSRRPIHSCNRMYSRRIPSFISESGTCCETSDETLRRLIAHRSNHNAIVASCFIELRKSNNDNQNNSLRNANNEYPIEEKSLNINGPRSLLSLHISAQVRLVLPFLVLFFCAAEFHNASATCIFVCALY